MTLSRPLFTAVAVLTLLGFGCTPQAAEPSLGSDWKTYTSDELHVTLTHPRGTTVKETGNGHVNGRQGGLAITEEDGTRNMSVVAYSTKEDLEQDFTSSGSVLGGLGLQSGTLALNDHGLPVYFGNHIADAPGGGDAFPYVAVEVVGPTYAYMLEFYNYSADPSDAAIQAYLESFQVN